jgi:hypothetical protein
MVNSTSVHNFFAASFCEPMSPSVSIGGAKSIAGARVKRLQEIFLDAREVAVSSAFFAFVGNQRGNLRNRGRCRPRASAANAVGDQ